MPWTLLDVGIGVLALLVLAVVLLRLWRRVKALTRATGEATTRVGEVTAALEAIQTRDA